jgi:hypothetical protein
MGIFVASFSRSPVYFLLKLTKEIDRAVREWCYGPRLGTTALSATTSGRTSWAASTRPRTRRRRQGC